MFGQPGKLGPVRDLSLLLSADRSAPVMPLIQSVGERGVTATAAIPFAFGSVAGPIARRDAQRRRGSKSMRMAAERRTAPDRAGVSSAAIVTICMRPWAANGASGHYKIPRIIYSDAYFMPSARS